MIKMPERLSRTTIYESDYICLYTDRVRMPSGDIIEKYHQIHEPHESVAIVIFDAADNILFIRNRRYTVGHPEWEIPAGRVEIGEDILSAAKREAMEETGCALRSIDFLCSQNPSNGMSDATLHVFAARVESEANLTDKDEIDSKRWFTKEEALELLRTNGTHDGISILAVLYALQFYR